MNNNNKKVWLWVGAVVVVGLIIWMVVRSRSVQNPSENLQNAITVSDQASNSVSVNIDSVTLAVPGFIEIHADTNGGPGTYVGSSKVLSAGAYTNQSIIMTTTPGTYYWAMLHADDGNGIFEATKDLPAKDAAGQIVMQRFQVKAANLINAGVDIKG